MDVDTGFDGTPSGAEKNSPAASECTGLIPLIVSYFSSIGNPISGMDICESRLHETAAFIQDSYWQGVEWQIPPGFTEDSRFVQVCPASCAMLGSYAVGCAPPPAAPPAAPPAPLPPAPPSTPVEGGDVEGMATYAIVVPAGAGLGFVVCFMLYRAHHGRGCNEKKECVGSVWVKAAAAQATAQSRPLLALPGRRGAA